MKYIIYFKHFNKNIFKNKILKKSYKKKMFDKSKTTERNFEYFFLLYN